MIKNAHGFTLIEQLVVLALIIALVGFGGIRMMQTNQQNDLEHATHNVETLMRFLQMKALQDGKVYRLEVDESKKRLILKRQMEDKSRFTSVKSNLIRSLQLGSALSFETEGRSEILFYPDGSISKNRLILQNESGNRIFFRLKNRIGSVEVSRV